MTEFNAFSIRAEGLTTLSNEPAYIAIRDMVMLHAFPESSTEDDPLILKDYRKAAGLAIKNIMGLATYTGEEREWYIDALKIAQDIGLEVVRGKGVTLKDPKQIIEDAKKASGKPTRAKPTITTTFAAFAQQITKTI